MAANEWFSAPVAVSANARSPVSRYTRARKSAIPAVPSSSIGLCALYTELQLRPKTSTAHPSQLHSWPYQRASRTRRRAMRSAAFKKRASGMGKLHRGDGRFQVRGCGAEIRQVQIEARPREVRGDGG